MFKGEYRRGMRMMRYGKYWIEKLRLEPHPEGGYFRQTYKADLVLARESLPEGFSGARAASTAIYFLLEGDDFSAFHRLRSDEVWHFYVGDALVVHVIDEHGRYSEIAMGRDPEAGGMVAVGVGGRGRFWVRVCNSRALGLVGGVG